MRAVVGSEIEIKVHLKSSYSHESGSANPLGRWSRPRQVWETGLKASARTLCVVFKSLGYVPCAEALAPTSYSRCCWAPRGGAWHVERART